MKILLFGKNGQLGWELQRSLAVLGEVVALGRGDPDLCGDLTNLEGLSATVRRVQPQVIVNAAAFTAVDSAESEPELAALVNAKAPGVLAEAANAAGAWLVHYSTDYVFDGSGTQAWREGDPTVPLNVYGRTKLEGERLVAAHCPAHLIFRTSWMCGARGGNFARTMLRLAAERESLSVVDDQFGAPTGADLVADVTAHAIKAASGNPALAGIYHLAAGGETSWHGYAAFVVATAARAGAVLKCGTTGVQPLPASAWLTAARRPNNSRLNTAKLQSAFGLSLPPWQPGVARMLQEILKP